MADYTIITDNGVALEVRVTLADGRVAITGVIANSDVAPHPDIPGAVAESVRNDLRTAAKAEQAAEIDAAVAVALAPAPVVGP